MTLNFINSLIDRQIGLIFTSFVHVERIHTNKITKSGCGQEKRSCNMGRQTFDK